MKGLILAAGFGNRMSPLTNNKHKTLLEVNGEAIMDRIVTSLVRNGVTNIVIVTGYRAEELKNHLLANFDKVKFEFINNPRFRETNNIYSLALAFEQIALDDDILLIESDLIFTDDVIVQAVHSPFENVALVSPYITGLDGTVVQVSGNKITNIFPPHLQDEKFNLFDKFKTLNIYKFSKDFCINEFKKLLVYYAQTIDDNCYYELILGILIYMQRQDIHCEIVDNHKWVEVDDPNDLMGAEFAFNKENRLAILEESFGGYWNYDILDFCFIRNMYFPTEAMIAEFKNNLGALLCNYGSKQFVLNRKLSYVLQCKEERLIALNGASQIYPLISGILKEKKVLIPAPTFGEYQRIFDTIDTYNDSGSIDKVEVEKKIPDNEIIVFVNPNNPTGSVISTDWIISLINKYPEKLFIVDESFIEFSDEKSIINYLETQSSKNVLVLRSMSKSYGLPGIRIGFVYTSNSNLYKIMSQQIPIWNLNSMAEFYLEIILKYKRYLSASFVKTKADRDEFLENLKKLEVVENVFPSGGNFIMAQTINNQAMNGLVQYLLNNEAIYIKEVTEKFADPDKRYYRFAVRLPHENQRLVDSISNFEKLIFTKVD